MCKTEPILLADVIRELLACCELNLDELEQETEEAIARAREALARASPPPSAPAAAP